MGTLLEAREATLPERRYVGIALTSAFASHDSKRVDQLRKQFIVRRFEIKGMLHPERYVCIGFTSDQLFTYLFCAEVDALAAVPEGMLGFVIPEQRYAVGRTEDGDPYELLHAYMKEHGLRNNPRGMALEVYNVLQPNCLVMWTCTFRCWDNSAQSNSGSKRFRSSPNGFRLEGACWQTKIELTLGLLSLMPKGQHAMAVLSAFMSMEGNEWRIADLRSIYRNGSLKLEI